MRKGIFTVLLALFSLMAIQAQWYVTKKGTGDGSSWEKASGDIQAMIDKAAAGDEVWVAKGVYTPTVKFAKLDTDGEPAGNRARTFRLRSGVSLYGGFAGVETDRDERDPALHETILSGALNTGEYAYRVVSVYNEDMAGAKLDGFTITGGRALHTFDDPRGNQIEIPVLDADGEETGRVAGTLSGAGITVDYSSDFVMNNLKISGNISVTTGGGFQITNSEDIEFTNSIIEANSTLDGDDGGGHIAGATSGDKAKLTLSGLIFRNNRSAAAVGGVTIKRVGIDATLENIVVENNRAETSSGGIMLTHSEVRVKGLYIKNNNSGAGAGGGTFEILSNSTFEDVQIIGNIAGAKSASAGGAHLATLTNVTIKGLIVKYNEHKEENVSGFYIDVLTTGLVIEDFTVSENKCVSNGALFIAANSNVTLINGRIEKNYGGVLTSYSSLTGKNLLIAENEMDRGAIMTAGAGGDVKLINCTIVKNSVKGTGLAGIHFGQPFTLTNCILWGNKSSDAPSNTYGTIGEKAITCLIQDDTDETKASLIGEASEEMEADEVFMDYDKGDYRLPSHSMAVGNGTNDGLFTSEDVDLDGNPRVADDIDLGAYEYTREQTDFFFAGGVLKDGVHTFTYTGEPIDLKVVNFSGTNPNPVQYSWDGKQSYHDEVGIVDAGEYTVHITLGGQPSPENSVSVVVEKANLYISFLPVDMLECSVTDAGVLERKEAELKLENDWSDYGATPVVTFASSNTDYVIVDGNYAKAVATGSAMITTSTNTTGIDALKNYNIIEGSALATVTMVRISGGTEGDPVEIPAGELAEGEDIIIEGGSTVTIVPDGATLPGDVIVEGGNGDVNVVGDLNTSGDLIVEEEGKVIIEDGDIITGGKVIVEENGELNTGGNVEAGGGMEIGDGGSANIGGDLITGENGDIIVGDNDGDDEGGSLIVGGGITTDEDGDLIITEGSTVNVEDGDVNVGGEVIIDDNGSLEIEGGDLIINGGGNITIGNGGSADIGGDLITGEGSDVTVGENGELTVGGDTQIGGNLTGETGSNITFEGDVIFEKEVTFEGEATFNGDVTFKEGGNFTNELPVFNGDVIISGDLTLPDDKTLVIDNNDNTITIDGEGGIDGNVTINGGTLVLGELTVTGDLNLTGVTLEVSKDAVLEVTGDLTVADSPRSVINLTDLDEGVNEMLTLTSATDPSGLFEIKVGGESPSSHGVTYSWEDNNDGTYTLKVTAQSNITLTYYTLKIHSTTKEGLQVWPGLGSFPIEANAYMSLDITLDAQHTGKSLSLIINGETIELTKSVAQTQYSHNLRFITKDMDIEIVLKEKTTTGNETIGAGEVKVYGLQGALRVETATLTDLTIYTIAGRPVASEKVNGTKEFYLPSGIYIVRTTISTPVKAVVR